MTSTTLSLSLITTYNELASNDRIFVYSNRAHLTKWIFFKFLNFLGSSNYLHPTRIKLSLDLWINPDHLNATAISTTILNKLTLHG